MTVVNLVLSISVVVSEGRRPVACLNVTSFFRSLISRPKFRVAFARQLARPCKYDSVYAAKPRNSLRPADFASSGHRGASAGHRLCEFQKSWHWPGVVRRADARTTSASGIKYV